MVGARFTTDGTPSLVTVGEVRRHREGVLLRLDEVGDRNAAELLAKATLSISAAERRALEEGEYWPEDLIGLTAVDPHGATLGEVTDVVLGTAQDRLVVTTPQETAVEVPFVAALVGEPHGGTIVITPPIGLFADGSSTEVEDRP